uniref:hypothetical protein n=1 Tax=Amycolatopsis sp. CA-096443 TaxID=3239919 RepID=UPI003F495F1C
MRLRLRRTLEIAASLAAAAGLAVGLSAPADAIVGGHRSTENLGGIGVMVHPDKGHEDWASCAAQPFGINENGETDLLVTAGQCVTVQPPAGQVRAMTPEGRKNFAAFRKATGRAGAAAAATGPSGRSGTGLQSTPEDPAQWKWVYGSVNRFVGTPVGVKRWIIPPAWAWGQPDARGDVWDLALIQLQHPVPVRGALIAPVLPWLPVTELGWGKDNPDPASWKNLPLGPWLRQNDVRVTAHADCAAAGIGHDEVCLGVAPDRGGTCLGDAGGLGLQRLGDVQLLTAIASRGVAAGCGTVNVYTRVWSHAAWILDQVRALEPRTRVAAASPNDIPGLAGQADYGLAG